MWDVQHKPSTGLSGKLESRNCTVPNELPWLKFGTQYTGNWGSIALGPFGFRIRRFLAAAGGMVNRAPLPATLVDAHNRDSGRRTSSRGEVGDHDT